MADLAATGTSLDPAAAAGARRAAWLTGLVVFAVYVATTSHLVLPADPGEFQTLAQVGGISHSGYAPVILLLRLFGKLPFGSPAFRANLLSCFSGAVALGLCAYVGARFTRRPAAGVVAALAFALGRSAWKEGTEAGVHAVALALDAVIFVLLLRFVRVPDKRGAFFMGLAGGIAAQSHLSAWALGPVVLAAGVAMAGRGRLRASHVATATLGLLLGLSTVTTLLASDRPGQPMNYIEDVMRLEPAAYLPNGPVPVTRLDRAAWLLSGRQYLAFQYDTAFVPKSRGRRVLDLFVEVVLNQFPLFGLPLALLGAWWAARRRVPWAWLVAVWAASDVVITNFAPSGFTNGYFFLPGEWCVALAAGWGLAWIAERRGWAFGLLAVAMLAAPLVRLALRTPPPLLDRYNLTTSVWELWPGQWSPLRHEPQWDRYGRQVMAALPERAAVLVGWEEGTVLRYFRYGESLRHDVDVVICGVHRRRVANAVRLARAEGRPVFATFPSDPTTPDSLEFVRLLDGPTHGLWRIVPRDSVGVR